MNLERHRVVYSWMSLLLWVAFFLWAAWVVWFFVGSSGVSQQVSAAEVARDEGASAEAASGAEAKDEAAGKKAKEISFKKDIEPLLKEKCWKCHGASVQKGELALHTPELIEKGSESGPVVLAGNGAGSRLYEAVKHGEMPPDNQGTLTDDETDLIKKWIDAGASFGESVKKAEREVTQHDVVPSLLLRCTVCHGRHVQEGGLDLRTRESMLKGGKSGPAFVVGKPDESLMVTRVRAEEMPPHAKLTDVSVKPMDPEELKTLTKWIAAGAPLAKEEPELAGTLDDPLVRPQDREFWAFQTPVAVPVPNVVDPTDAARMQSPIDPFLLEKLNAKGLTLAAKAERGVLIRRVSLDLTGLPPTPAETDEFLADTSPDAFERLVDRLLASPHYGERWGRHWLDVAGYADCEGRREQHLPRPFAWRYRDYVIAAMNADKPYDRFLLEQIAGDELADYRNAPVITKEIEDNLVATAFLRLSPDPTWANLTGFVPDRLEVISDSLDVLSSGVMGLTFKCAKCHTHKFDPIPQRDYYRLAAVLKPAYDEHDWMKPQLISFGGAMSKGFEERFLPYVTTEERQAWERHEAAITQQVAEVKSQPQSPDTEKRIKELEAKRQPEPRIMALWDRGEPSPTYVYRRGDYTTAGAYVTAGAPSVLMTPRAASSRGATNPPTASTGRRLALAQWLVEPDNPLTARVFVNRVWKHHFGQGIVRSLGNFGKVGERPSHPELLDYVARDFIRHEWSLKSLHRTLVQSAAYQQVSLTSEAARQVDPANVLLSRMPLQRLDAEQLWDSMLAIAGQLNDAGGGVPEPVKVRPDGLVSSGHRRTVYVQQLRKHPLSLMESFDFPAMNPNCLQRSESLVPTQALHLWNDSTVRQLAAQLAARVDGELGETRTDAGRVERLYRLALARPALAEESAAAVETLEQLRDAWRGPLAKEPSDSPADADRKALSTLCHTILNSADFLYVD